MTTTKAGADGADRPGPALLPPGWARFSGVLLILLSLIPAAGCYAAFTWWIPHDKARYQDYQAAQACPPRETEQRPPDCLSTRHFTVLKIEVKPRSNKTILAGENSWRGTVSFGDPGPLRKRLKPRDQVTATVWRREIVVLSKDGIQQNTSNAPRDELQATAAFGMIGALVAAQSLIFGAVRLLRPRGYKPFSLWLYGISLLLTIFAIFFGVGVPAVLLGIRWQFVPPVSAAVAACAAGLMYLFLRPRAADDA
ncbi:hypothetical protein [Actinomadura sp. 9N407]|uniref:hypothetical protein n=1 Tax=Actinomadura sp. 9N407 TaxID=3375154 RepID=UPI0037904F56